MAFRVHALKGDRSRERCSARDPRSAAVCLVEIEAFILRAQSPLVCIAHAGALDSVGEDHLGQLPLSGVLRQMLMDRNGAHVLSGLQVSFRDSLSRLTDTNEVRQTQIGACNFKTAPNKTLVLPTNAVPSTSASPSE